MKCDICDRPATVHLIEIKGGKKVEKHLCEEHALAEGVAVQVSHPPLTEWLEKFVMKHEAAETTPASLQCGECGLSYSRFRKTGLLGCPTCYTTFEDALIPLLERAHEGQTTHFGKVPRQGGDDEVQQRKLMQLRRQLDDAVANENYERAAQLRDKVLTLESKIV